MSTCGRVVDRKHHKQDKAHSSSFAWLTWLFLEPNKARIMDWVRSLVVLSCFVCHRSLLPFCRSRFSGLCAHVIYAKLTRSSSYQIYAQSFSKATKAFDRRYCLSQPQAMHPILRI